MSQQKKATNKTFQNYKVLAFIWSHQTTALEPRLMFTPAQGPSGDVFENEATHWIESSPRSKRPMKNVEIIKSATTTGLVLFLFFVFQVFFGNASSRHPSDSFCRARSTPKLFCRLRFQISFWENLSWCYCFFRTWKARQLWCSQYISGHRTWQHIIGVDRVLKTNWVTSNSLCRRKTDDIRNKTKPVVVAVFVLLRVLMAVWVEENDSNFSVLFFFSNFSKTINGKTLIGNRNEARSGRPCLVRPHEG